MPLPVLPRDATALLTRWFDASVTLGIRPDIEVEPEMLTRIREAVAQHPMKRGAFLLPAKPWPNDELPPHHLFVEYIGEDDPEGMILAKNWQGPYSLVITLRPRHG